MNADERLSIALHDILDAIAEIRLYTDGLDLDGFRLDGMRRRAVERCIEIISEASRRLPESWKGEQPEIRWRDIAGIGNVIRHDYEGVEVEIIWTVVREHLDPLEHAVRAILKRHPTQPR
jgi:uncharacterized protein with HEPN domain